MRNTKNIIRITGIIFIFFSCSGDSRKERELFSKIKVGMSQEDVIKILGTPDDTTYSIVDTTEVCLTFFTRNKSGLRPSFPEVCFDSSRKVKLASYGDE
ncbi:MAG: SmpA / OmlA family [Bacteroidota bacterium]|jgi:hypothetical protein